MGDSGTEGVIGKRGDNGSRQNDGNQVTFTGGLNYAPEFTMRLMPAFQMTSSSDNTQI